MVVLVGPPAARSNLFSVLFSLIEAKKYPVGFPTRHQRRFYSVFCKLLSIFPGDRLLQPFLTLFLQINRMPTFEIPTPCLQNSKMPYCSIRTVILDGYCPPWKIVLCATTVVWLLKPSFVLLFGNTKFFALEVIVTRIRCPFLKQLEIFVVRIVSGTTSPGFKKSAWSNPLRYFADKIPSASLIERPFSSTSVNRTMKSVYRCIGSDVKSTRLYRL